jgi:hypothetical protein
VKYKTILLIVLLAFAVSLAVVVGQRLSSEAMAVVVGVVAGVAASIPTSLIVVWVAMRTRPGATVVEERRPQPAEPRIVVVPAPAAAQPPSYPQPVGPHLVAPYPSSSSMGYQPVMPGHRQFTVIGGAGDFE